MKPYLHIISRGRAVSTALLLAVPLCLGVACTESPEDDPTPRPSSWETPLATEDLDEDGFFLWNGDCNNYDSTVHLGAPELMDEKDNDCDGLIDEDTANADLDGDGYYPSTGDCDEADPAVHPDQVDPTDGKDNDCDGLMDEQAQEADEDGDGFSLLMGDCDDQDPAVHPYLTDGLDGVDTDCDGFVDEDAPYGGTPSRGTVESLSLEAALASLHRTPTLEENEELDWSEVVDVQWIRDLDGDGFDELAVSVIETDFTGKVFLLYGGKEGLSGAAPLEDQADAVIVGATGANMVGLKLVGRGDVTGDGFNDLLVGDPLQQRVLLYRGGKRLSGTVDSRAADATFCSYTSGAYAIGFGLDVPGDVDGDGILDLIIGQPTYNALKGRVFVVRGGSHLQGLVDLAKADATIEGFGWLEGAGAYVGGMGDLNGDGLADFALTAPTFEHLRADRTYGAVHIFYGHKTAFSGPRSLEEADARLTSAEGELLMTFGHGDFDGDGLDDFALGLPSRRQIFLIYGREERLSGSLSLEHTAETLVEWSQLEGDRYWKELYDFGFGATVSLDADFNQDGRRDLVVAVPSRHAYADYLEWDITLRLEPGYAVVFPGTDERPETIRAGWSRSLEVHGQARALERVWPVAAGGDFDGDGKPELAMGGQNAQQSRVSWNATYLFSNLTLPE